MARKAINEIRPTLTEAQRVYLAGIIDGEGCIGVFTRRGRKDWMRVHIQVTNTSIELLAWLRAVCPLGTIQPRRDVRANRKPSWCWRLVCYDAYWLLHQVKPWLVVKRAQAEAVILLEEIEAEYSTLTIPVRAARVVCFDTIARLNYRARRKVAA